MAFRDRASLSPVGESYHAEQGYRGYGHAVSGAARARRP
jgi:hypothetical protein